MKKHSLINYPADIKQMDNACAQQMMNSTYITSYSNEESNIINNNNNNIMKDMDKTKLSPEALPPPLVGIDRKWNMEFNMWHSFGPFTGSNKLTDSDLLMPRTHSQEQLGTKEEVVYNLVSLLKVDNREEISKTLLAMSSTPDSCNAIRQYGCLPLLVRLIHGTGESKLVRSQASGALRNIVKYNTDEKSGRRESRVLKLIEHIMDFCDNNEDETKMENEHPSHAVAALMKLSFDEEYRLTMCQLGGLEAIARLLYSDHEMHGTSANTSNECITLRRYAGMALTNLSFGDKTNKAQLCSMRPFMVALIAQLSSTSEDLCQVTASILRNLSWRTDNESKDILKELGAVSALMRAAIRVERESTLKSVLSALWNMSAHCITNKEEICAVDGAIEYLVKMLNYDSPSKTLAVVENAGGILRNISNLIAIRDDYRSILRRNNCLEILLRQLKSPSLTIVSNACGSLWNLSARCSLDQKKLWELGAVPMLRSLIHSKHQRISVGSSAALKNLLTNRPDMNAADKNNKGAPTLLARKRRALEKELNASLTETYDNLDQIENWDSFTSSSITDLGKTDAVVVEDKESTVGKEMDVEPQEDGYKKVEETYNEDESFGNYAETDLDQPTNYSLRYVEQDTPQTYCTEGTPYTFSSSNSVTDLQITPSAPRPDENPTDTILTYCTEGTPYTFSSSNSVTDLQAETSTDKENVCKDTPMMFSRTSSIESLSSCGEIVDDASSLVSDFSRLASGLISPSELPDSPTQTIPPSPIIKNDGSVFEDCVRIFKDENTPMQFSTGTSLSSLTFDEECLKTNELTCINEETSMSSNSVITSCETAKYKGDERMLEDDELSLEEQQALLSDCIKSGMPPKHSKKHGKKRYGSNGSINEDSTVNFCTEDTPASISHAASNSDLSILCLSEDSFLQDSILPLSYQDNNPDELSPEENQKLLNFCIAAGLETLNEFKKPEKKGNNNNAYDLPPDEEQKKLVKLCIATGIKSIKDSSCDLENIGPPSFLADANLENSLTNIDSIISEVADPSTYTMIDDITLIDDNINFDKMNLMAEQNNEQGKITPKQKRIMTKDRYSTYTINTYDTKNLKQETNTENTGPLIKNQNIRKSLIMKERRLANKDRFKTRTLSDGDFEEISNFQQQAKQEEEIKNDMDDDLTLVNVDTYSSYSENSSDTESKKESEDVLLKAKIVVPVEKKAVRGLKPPKSSIPIVRSKIQQPKMTNNNNNNNKVSKIPAPLQRQGTFTKEEQSSIPIPTVKPQLPRKMENKGYNRTTTNKSQIYPGEPVLRNSKIRSPGKDTVKNRWSISDNNINNPTSSNFRTNSASNLSSPVENGSRINNASCQSAPQKRKEVASRIAGIWKRPEEQKRKTDQPTTCRTDFRKYSRK